MDKVIIIGAGPAGLAAGYNLTKNNLDAVIIEKEDQVGGICRTINYKGYRFDIGGHRFFTDLLEIERMWHEILGEKLLKRPRLSRIYYKNKFFDYPLNLNNTFENIGLFGSFLIFASYLKSQIKKDKNILSFEDYVIKCFGKRLFRIFFKNYTEKVWGMPCSEISADWAKERMGGLSMLSAITDALVFKRNKNIRTLVKEFYYPVLGPGMLYEKMAERITGAGNRIETGLDVVEIVSDSRKILYVIAKDKHNDETEFKANELISSMPITELITKLRPIPPKPVLEACKRLRYRDFLTINLICSNKYIFSDNWLYINSQDTALCRIQNYKNWSPHMVPTQKETTLGLEYFCFQNDEIWRMKDHELFEMSKSDLAKIGLKADIDDFFVFRMPKAYPVYTIGYKRYLKVITDYIQGFRNLQLIGRAGNFRYDNMDAAMSSGIYASKRIINQSSRSGEPICPPLYT